MSTAGLHIQAQDVRKSFGMTEVLHGVHLGVPYGGIEGLVGHNGAGKSTLISILAGLAAADAGTFLLDGENVSAAGVTELERRGLVLVPQVTSVFDRLSVLDNLLIPRRFPTRAVPAIRWTEARRIARNALSRVGLSAGLDALTAELSVAARRRLMIARALIREPRVLILDEPTEAFAEAEVTELFGLLRELVAGGVTMVYVSHRLGEVLEICDHVTVMREGVTVDRFAARDLSRPALLEAMLGQVPQLEKRERDHAEATIRTTPSVIALDRVSTRKLRDVSLAVQPGEIVGLYGLAGSGRSELLKAIAGMTPTAGGQIVLHGNPLSGSVAARRGEGIAYQPQDTATDAALTRLSIRENVTIAVPGGVRRQQRLPVVSRRREAEITRQSLNKVGLNLDPEAELGTLSGGMQQRVMMARSIVARASVWLLDEPMTGLDVRSRVELAEVLRGLVRGQANGPGHGALVVLSDFDDVRLMCDRVYTMRAGALTGAFATSAVSEHDLLHAVSFESTIAA